MILDFLFDVLTADVFIEISNFFLQHIKYNLYLYISVLFTFNIYVAY